MDDSEISILDSIRFFEKNLDFKLRVIFKVYLCSDGFHFRSFGRF